MDFALRIIKRFKKTEKPLIAKSESSNITIEKLYLYLQKFHSEFYTLIFNFQEGIKTYINDCIQFYYKKSVYNHCNII